MIRFIIKYLFLLLIFTFNSLAIAKPTVIYDSGLTKSIRPYLERGGFSSAPSLKVVDKASLQQLNRNLALLKPSNPLPSFFPVKSNMKPGRVITRKLDLQGIVHPFCVIGADSQSLNWLTRVAQVLIDNQVVCLITNVDSYSQYMSIQKKWPDLKLQLAKGDSLAKSLGLYTYPFVISNGYIEQ